MKRIPGLIAQIRPQEGRIGRAWRNVSKSVAPMLRKVGISSEGDLMRAVSVTTGKKG